jgi:hypothetical protein
MRDAAHLPELLSHALRLFVVLAELHLAFNAAQVSQRGVGHLLNFGAVHEASTLLAQVSGLRVSVWRPVHQNISSCPL